LAGWTPLSGTERLFRAIARSLLLYAIASPWLLRVTQRVASGKRMWPWEPIIGLSLVEFVAPLVLGLAVVGIRRSEWFRRLTRRLTRRDARTRSWDFAFSSQARFFVRAKLKTGERVGGVYADDSFASAFPEPQDVFLQQVWKLTSDGTPDYPVPGSRGLVLRQEDVELVELIDLEVEDGETDHQ
jgi:uncharacterized protein DUF6338